MMGPINHIESKPHRETSQQEDKYILEDHRCRWVEIARDMIEAHESDDSEEG